MIDVCNYTWLVVHINPQSWRYAKSDDNSIKELVFVRLFMMQYFFNAMILILCLMTYFLIELKYFG